MRVPPEILRLVPQLVRTRFDPPMLTTSKDAGPTANRTADEIHRMSMVRPADAETRVLFEPWDRRAYLPGNLAPPPSACITSKRHSRSLCRDCRCGLYAKIMCYCCGRAGEPGFSASALT